jgi:hypothetical protein
MYEREGNPATNQEDARFDVAPVLAKVLEVR